jgi:hypothetical protein
LEYVTEFSGGNFCVFKSRPGCFYYYEGFPENFLLTLTFFLCFKNGFVKAFVWTVKTNGFVYGEGNCGDSVTMYDLTWLGGSYDTTDAYCVISFEPCTAVEPVQKTCCFHCTDWGGSPGNLPDTIDVTISSVESNNPAVAGDIVNFVGGAYTLTRASGGCHYEFHKTSQETNCFPSGPKYALNIYLNPVRLFAGVAGCESGYRWRLTIDYDSPIFGCVPRESISRLMFSQDGNLHEIPNCCAAESFLLTGKLNDSTWTADFEIHCD